MADDTLSQFSDDDTPEKQERRKRASLAATWERRVDSAYHDERDWRDKTRSIVSRYTDERESAYQESSQFNIFYSNVETLKPACYANPPTPEVRRRYLDKDPVARRGSTILQRALGYTNEASNLDEVLERDVDDLLLGGRGQLWVRYRPYMVQVPASGDQKPPDESARSAEQSPVNPAPQERLVYEAVEYEYVPWGLFVFDRAPTWKRVRWVCRIHCLHRHEVAKQYGEAVANAVPYQSLKESTIDESSINDNISGDYNQVAIFYEIWNKEAREVLVVCKGYGADLIVKKEDPLRLEGFFPCPEPLIGIHSAKHFIPRPEFLLYQDLANELDDVTQRLKVLTTALRRRGIYDSSIEGLDRLTGLGDNQFIGIENFRALVEKGGLSSVFDEQDLTPLVTVIRELSVRQEQLKQMIYEVTGIADIIRGATDPDETLGAQQLKSQFGSLRIRRRQKKIALFARNAIRIAGEIIAEHFRPDTLMMVAGIKIVESPDMVKLDHEMTIDQFNEAVALLKSEKLRGFRIEIETDSTIELDTTQENPQRIELLGAIGNFLASAKPIADAGALSPQVLMELLMFTIRGFKVGPRLEDLMELALAESSSEDAQQSQQLQAQVQELTLQLQQIQEEAARLAEENESLKADRSLEEAKVSADIERRDQQAASKMALEEKVARFQLMLEAQEAAFDRRLREQEAALMAKIRIADQRSKSAVRAAGKGTSDRSK